jgi:hypothetical protein
MKLLILSDLHRNWPALADDRKSLRRLGHHPFPKNRRRGPTLFSAELLEEAGTAGPERPYVIPGGRGGAVDTGEFALPD